MARGKGGKPRQVPGKVYVRLASRALNEGSRDGYLYFLGRLAKRRPRTTGHFLRLAGPARHDLQSLLEMR